MLARIPQQQHRRLRRCSQQVRQLQHGPARSVFHPQKTQGGQGVAAAFQITRRRPPSQGLECTRRISTQRATIFHRVATAIHTITFHLVIRAMQMMICQRYLREVLGTFPGKMILHCHLCAVYTHKDPPSFRIRTRQGQYRPGSGRAHRVVVTGGVGKSACHFPAFHNLHAVPPSGLKSHGEEAGVYRVTCGISYLLSCLQVWRV